MSGVSVGCCIEKSEEYPHGWKDVMQISGDEVCCVVLGGDGTTDARSAHGNVNQFKADLKKALGFEIPIYGVSYDFGDVNYSFARQKEFLRHGMILGKKAKDIIIQKLKKVNTDSAYIEDLYKKVIEPRITQNHGTERLDAEEAAKRLRKVTFLAHCHGAHVALKLEDMMAEKMKALGYSAKEQAFIQKQMLVVAQAPAAPLGISKSTFVSFLSAADLKMPSPLNPFSMYIRNRMAEHENHMFGIDEQDSDAQKNNRIFDLKPCYLSGRLGNFFLVREKYADSRYGNLREHDFVGRVDKNFTRDGQLLQYFAYNTLVNGVQNSLAQKDKLVFLPEVDELVCRSDKQRQIFEKMKENGRALGKEILAYARQINKRTPMQKEV